MKDSIHLNDLQTYGLEMRTMLDNLSKAFPNYPPNPHDTHQLIMYRSGQQSVIEWIRTYMEDLHNG